MSELDTKQRLLDTAERLFALQGVHTTSLRQITAEAEANLAAVNYHFGSKDRLVEEVIERRLLPLNAERTQRLLAVRTEAEGRGVRPTVRDSLEAFIEPTFQLLQSDPGGRHFALLVGRALVEPDETILSFFVHSVGPLFHLLFETLCLALPDHDRDLVFWRLQFVLGAMSHIIRWYDRFERPDGAFPLPAGVSGGRDSQTTVDRLTAFLTAGMEAP